MPSVWSASSIISARDGEVGVDIGAASDREEDSREYGDIPEMSHVVRPTRSSEVAPSGEQMSYGRRSPFESAVSPLIADVDRSLEGRELLSNEPVIFSENKTQEPSIIRMNYEEVTTKMDDRMREPARRGEASSGYKSFAVDPMTDVTGITEGFGSRSPSVSAHLTEMSASPLSMKHVSEPILPRSPMMNIVESDTGRFPIETADPVLETAEGRIERNDDGFGAVLETTSHQETGVDADVVALEQMFHNMVQGRRFGAEATNLSVRPSVGLSSGFPYGENLGRSYPDFSSYQSFSKLKEIEIATPLFSQRSFSDESRIIGAAADCHRSSKDEDVSSPRRFPEGAALSLHLPWRTAPPGPDALRKEFTSFYGDAMPARDGQPGGGARLSETVVHVHIGRIEIKAPPRESISPQRKNKVVSPVMSLDDYLKLRTHGER